ncbi:MAG: hypothetical protein ACI3V2_02095 [Faecousia sp.]
MRNTKKERENPKRLIMILSIGIVICLAVTAWALFFRQSNDALSPDYEPQGVVGKVTDGWDTGLEDPPAPEQKGIQIPGYSTAEMKAGDSSLHLSIGNPPANTCGFYATLKLADGTVLYRSELLEPGFGLTEVPLAESLDAGEYTAIVLYECVTLDESHTRLNSAESEFKLIVK